VPATFARLSNNVSRYLTNKYVHRLGREVVSGMNRYAWLGRLLPSKTSLLRAPYLVHVILEDWLLEQEVPRKAAVPDAAEMAPAEATGIGLDAIVGESNGLLPR
jgi:[acyl-carrier-protein] S-malonyltransferase